MKLKKRLIVTVLLFALCVGLFPSHTEAAAIRLNSTSLKLYVGQTATLKLKHATGKVKWSSSDKSVAAVSKGTVTAKAAGSCTITATNKKVTYTCRVSVTKPAVSLTSKKLYVGQSFTLKTNPSTLPVTWSTDDPEVATVSSEGAVSAVGGGDATISAQIYGQSYDCEVTVIKPELSDTAITLYPGDSYHVMCTDSAVKVTSWKSSKPEVATVNSLGVIRASKPGTTKITAKIYQQKYTCTVTVTKLSALSRYGIPSYWEDEINTSVASIRSVDVTMSKHSAGFLYFTDSHWRRNAKVSPGIINYLSPLLHMNVVFGGDIIDTYDDTKQEAYDEIRNFYDQFNVPIFTVIGNHDWNQQNNPDSSTILNGDEMYALLLRQEEIIANTESTYEYAYFDNPSQKVRYLTFLYDAHTTITDKMYQWIDARINELSSDWTVVLFSHAAWKPVSDGSALTLTAQARKFADHILELEKTAEATIACWITGHIHQDYSEFVTKDDQHLLIISSNCDAYKKSTIWGGWEMIANTSTEQVIDCVQMDLDSKKIYMTRIGAGYDRAFAYGDGVTADNYILQSGSSSSPDSGAEESTNQQP